MKKLIRTKVLVIGGGAAGMSAVLHLETNDIAMVEMPKSNSVFSPWNIQTKPKEEMRQKMLQAGNNMNNIKLLDKFLEHHDNTVRDLESYGIVFRKSNIGAVPVCRRPGLEIKKVLSKKIKEKKIKIAKGRIENFILDDKKSIIGVIIRGLSSKDIIHLYFDYMILAGGGMSSLYEFATGEDTVNGSILALACENGLVLTNMEFSMFHPFLITDKRLPRVLVSGDILTKMEFTDEKGRVFLSKKIIHALKDDEYHSVFPQMVREFYEQSLKSKIFAELTCDHVWFENYKKTNEFGRVFEGYTVKMLGKIEIHPAFHSLIGGIMINEKAQTSQKNIYAAGEICGGLHGSNRIGGTGVSEAWVFGKLAAQDINQKHSSNSSNNKNEKSISSNIVLSKKHGIRKKFRKEIWKSFGPIKSRKNIVKIIDMMEKESVLSSEEKLFLNIAKISLLRNNSIGSFFREDLPVSQKDKNSYIKNDKIYFK